MVTPPRSTSSLALVEGHEAQPLSALVHDSELPLTTTIDQDQGEQLRGALDGRANGEDVEVPSIEYEIYGARLEGYLTIGRGKDNSAAQLPPFISDEGSNFQMVSVPNRLVKPIRYRPCQQSTIFST